MLIWALSVTFWPSQANAVDRGEMALRLSADNELAILHDPNAAFTSVSEVIPTYLPRFGADLDYGVTSWLAISIGGMVSLNREVVAENVVFQGIKGTLRGDYLDVLVPVQAAFIWDRGTAINWLFAASGGPTFIHWRETALIRPQTPNQPAGRYPVETNDAWHTRWFARVGVSVQWRPLDWLLVEAGPYAMRVANGDLHVGFAVQPSFAWGVGGF